MRITYSRSVIWRVLGGRVGLFRGELAEGLQRGDGGLEESLVAGAFLAAGRGLQGFFFRVLLLGGRDLGILRAPPAVHRFAVDGGALGEGKDALLPRGGACPAFFEFAEVAGDDQRLGAESSAMSALDQPSR